MLNAPTQNPSSTDQLLLELFPESAAKSTKSVGTQASPGSPQHNSHQQTNQHNQTMATSLDLNSAVSLKDIIHIQQSQMNNVSATAKLISLFYCFHSLINLVPLSSGEQYCGKGKMCSVAINCEQDRFNAINPTLRETAALECTRLVIHSVFGAAGDRDTVDI